MFRHAQRWLRAPAPVCVLSTAVRCLALHGLPVFAVGIASGCATKGSPSAAQVETPRSSSGATTPAPIGLEPTDSPPGERPPIIFPCQQSAQCHAHLCLKEQGRCAWPCQAHTDCQAGFECLPPACVPIMNPSTASSSHSQATPPTHSPASATSP